MDGTPTLLRNVIENGNHWVELKLVGGKKIPTDAVGATVYLTHNGIRQRGDVLSGGSFISSNDQRIHFGLGEDIKIDQVQIRWPGGAMETVKPPGVDRIFTIEQGRGVVGQMCATCAPGKSSPSR